MKMFFRECLSAVFAVLILFPMSLAEAGSVVVPGGYGNFTVAVTSMKEGRFRTTIRQQFDFSCGSAALATLLSHHYEDPVTEQQVFKEMYDIGDQEKIKTEGFSLLDMKNYLEARGYTADGYRITLDKLQEIGIPAIVLINNQGYRHFVVVKGLTSEEVLLGDPSLGTRNMRRNEFEGMWNGLVFLVRNKKSVAQNHFNNVAEWRTRIKAPLGSALNRSELANITLLMSEVSGL